MSAAHDKQSAGRAGGEPAESVSVEAKLAPATVQPYDFHRFSSKSNDIAIPIVTSAAIVYLVAISNAPWLTLLFSVINMGLHAAISIKIRRSRHMGRLHVGLARFAVNVICLPAITWSTFGADMGWIMGMALILFTPAYFSPLARVAVVLLLMAGALVPHTLLQPDHAWDPRAFVMLGVTGLFSVPLWGRLERNFYDMVRISEESNLPAHKRAELFRYQRRLIQGLVVSGSLFIAGVLITLVVYERLLEVNDPSWAGDWQEHNLLLARLWLLLGAITTLAFSTLVYVVFGDRAHMEVMVHHRTAELAAAKRGVEAANRAKSLFLANMSHELRTPMTGVIGATDVLLADQTDPAKREFLNIIKASGQAMIAIIDDILDLSRIESGKVQLECTSFDLHECLRMAVRSMQLLADSKRVRLTLICDPSLPRFIYTDQVRLRQIMTNLVGNAIKFSEEGQVDVIARADTDARTLHVEVHDTGIGLSMENSTRLFRAFEQEDAGTTRRYGGSGLGLAICSQLCQLLGGDIDVESQLGVGSVFLFHIQYQPAAEPELSTTRRATTEQATAEARTLGTGLLVEDNVISQKVAKHLLARHFERVLVASTGNEALALALEQHPDMIFMDVHMPEMDGLEATRRIRAESGRHMPIIALTASAFPEDRQRCLESGMDDFLSKPMSAAELAEVITRNADDRAGEPAGALVSPRGS